MELRRAAGIIFVVHVVSISDAPRGTIKDNSFRVRWIGLDESSYPNFGEMNPITNTLSGPPAPDAIVYQYSLDGIAWSTWTTATYADISNLPNGSYTFSVRARDAAGNQSAIVSRSIVIAVQ